MGIGNSSHRSTRAAGWLLFGWLAEWLAGCCGGWLGSWRAGWRGGWSAGCGASWPSGWSVVGWLAGSLAGALTDLLASPSAGLPAGSLAGTLAGSLAGFLAGRLASLLAGLLAGGLAGLLAGVSVGWLVSSWRLAVWRRNASFASSRRSGLGDRGGPEGAAGSLIARCSKYRCTLALACSAALRDARFGAGPSSLSSLSLHPLPLFSLSCPLPPHALSGRLHHS